jgi:hypothetical protein
MGFYSPLLRMFDHPVQERFPRRALARDQPAEPLHWRGGVRYTLRNRLDRKTR